VIISSDPYAVREAIVKMGDAIPVFVGGPYTEPLCFHHMPCWFMKTEELTLTQALERIFTIDGRGRPAKAKLMLELMESYESDPSVLRSAIKEVGERKFIWHPPTFW
jgi:hypothetical protein